MVNSAALHTIGSKGVGNYLNGYLADVHFIDGQALAPTDFGETNTDNLWVPIAYAGTYGWFDQSQTWSSGKDGDRSDYPVTNVFDASLTTLGYGSANQTITVTLPGGSIALTSLRVKADRAGTATGKFYVNGNDYTSQIASGTNWNTITGETSITSIAYASDSGSNFVGLYAVEVNGKLLIDSGITGIADNSFHLPFSDNSSNAALGTDTSGNSNTWTVNNLTASTRIISAAGSTSGSPYSTTYLWSTAFDGSITLIGAVSNAVGANSYVHTFTSSIPCTTAAFVVNQAYIAELEVGNGCAINGTVLTATASANWTKTTNTLPVGAGNVGDYFVYTVNLGGTPLSSVGVSNQLRIAAVLVDGVPIPATGLEGDSFVDSPTNGDTANDTGAGGEVVGNYATLNPLQNINNDTFSDGNLKVQTNSINYGVHTSTIATPLTGKWYAEVLIASTSGYDCISIVPSDSTITTNNHGPSFPNAVSYGGWNGVITKDSVFVATGSQFTTNDIIGIAYDADNSTVVFYRNGVAQPTVTGVAAKEFFFAGADYNASGPGLYVWNFGQRAFAHPLSGYKSLNTANLPEPTIADGSKYFDTKLYTGNDNTQTISGMSLRPDLLWLKSRAQATNHEIFDVVRGSNKILFPNLTNAETTDSNRVTSFNSDGFGLGPNSNANVSGGAVAWAWNAGSSNTTIAAGTVQNVTAGNAYSAGWAGSTSGTWADTDSWSGLSTVSGTAKGYFSSTENLSDGSVISAANGSFGAGSAGSNGWVLRASTSCTLSLTVYPNITEIAVTTSDSQTFANRTIVATNPSSGSAVRVTGKCFWFSSTSQMSVSTMGTVNNAPALPSIASTVRANPSAGFSIVSWSSASNAVTGGHGLNAAPKIYIVKDRNNADGWVAVTTLLTNTTDYLYLNTTAAAANFGVAAPTSSTFIPAQSTNSNYIAYCFAPVEGYSAMGSYQGNGNASGPFVYTGFKIRWLMVKSSSHSGEHWLILDTARDSYNVADATIYANLSNAEAEASVLGIDILSNGFKPRGTNAGTNASGYTYIYLAFASHPFASNGGLAR